MNDKIKGLVPYGIIIRQLTINCLLDGLLVLKKIALMQVTKRKANQNRAKAIITLSPNERSGKGLLFSIDLGNGGAAGSSVNYAIYHFVAG